MKKVLCMMLFLISCMHMIYAHGQGTHQYMVREAYKLLKQYVGQDIREMKDHVGYDETGNQAFNPGNLLVIGAHREDVEDIVFGYGGAYITNTHFWDPDMDDGSHFISPTGGSYENAYEKATKYFYSGPIFWPYTIAEPFGSCGVPPQYIVGIKFRYRSLIDFYKTGYIEIIAVMQTSGNFLYLSSPCSKYITAKNNREKVTWEILGRICHLLGDMTIPARTHNDPHWPDLDSYEEWMNQPSIFNQWTYQNAINQGGLINPTTHSNPLKHLFYSTSQITNFFPSDDVDGNNINRYNDPFSLYPGLSEFINNLNSQYRWPPLASNPLIPALMNSVSNNSFVYGIRTIAGLFYWFAKEADILPKPLAYVYLSGTYMLYQGGTGNWYVQLGNGLSPFTYQWEIMYLDGAGFLQNYESVKKEKEKREKEKKRDGDITIESVPSNYWFSVGTNSSTFSKPHNPYDLRDFKLRCTVTDGSNTTKVSNEWTVDVIDTPPPQGSIVADSNNDIISLAKYSEEISIPIDYALNQNYPNPFNPTTRILYSMPDANFVTLKIYDMLGSEIATLVNENKPAGKFEVEFNASKLSSGTYVYKLVAGNYQITKKMQLVK